MLTPSATVPMMISEEPPPTSTTPISPSTGWPRVLVAPTKASRPSSSSLRTSTGIPATREISATTASRLVASRIAAVATTDRLGAQLLREADLGGDHLGDLGDLLVVDRPLCFDAFPIRV